MSSCPMWGTAYSRCLEKAVSEGISQGKGLRPHVGVSES